MSINPLLKQLVSKKAAAYNQSGMTRSVRPKEGRNVYRFIAPAPGEVPWVKEDGMFWRDLGVHWIKPALNAKPIAVVGCEEICYGRPSALAAAIDAAIASAYDEDSKKLYMEWKARKSVVVNAVVRETGEVSVLELSTTTWAKVLDQFSLYADSGVNIFDHKSGMDVIITKTGKGLNTNYEVAVAPMVPGRTFSPVTDEQVRQAVDLDQWIQANFFRGEEQKALNAVAQIAGVVPPQIGAPAQPVAALTSAAASVAPVATPAAAAPVAAPAPAAAPAAAAAPAPAAAPAQAAPAAASAAIGPETTLSELPQDEQDALLAELESLGV